jgi:RimJ/RimL family protein N-acetyltransferase
MGQRILTPRLILRTWREADREPFANMNSDPQGMQYFPAVLSRPESDSFFDRIQSDFETQRFGLFAAELRATETFVGYIGLAVPSFEAHFTPCVEIGWRLLRSFWNRGLATEGAWAVLKCGFEKIGLDEIVSFTAAPNLPSRRVMEKLGMTHDPADDFSHPKLPDGHWLRWHVLYRLRRTEFVLTDA